jgi:hypothetical protein
VVHREALGLDVGTIEVPRRRLWLSVDAEATTRLRLEHVAGRRLTQPFLAAGATPHQHTRAAPTEERRDGFLLPHDLAHRGNARWRTLRKQRGV